MTIKEYIDTNLPLTIREGKEDKHPFIGLPHPYIIPSATGMFQEMYYWDTYFANAGLIQYGNVQQAKNNVDNLMYLLERFGFVLNGSRVDFTYNSQPPFLALMIREVYDVTGDKEWLAGAYRSLQKEHRFWVERRGSACGLSRYDSQPMPEDEARNAAEGLLVRLGYHPEGKTTYELGRALHAVGESGWDITPRFTYRTYAYAPADLNALLYAQEDQLSYFAAELGLAEESAAWAVLRDERAALMRQYLRGKDGVFYDYDTEFNCRERLVSCACFYPLYVGMATEEEAKAALAVLPRIEMEHGVVACEQCDVRGTFQWGYPNGWAPMQRIVVEGLLRYGYREEALRIAEKFVNTVERSFAATGHLWEKYNVVQGNVEVTDEYEMPAMLGWTFAVYVGFCKLLGRPIG